MAMYEQFTFGTLLLFALVTFYFVPLSFRLILRYQYS